MKTYQIPIFEFGVAKIKEKPAKTYDLFAAGKLVLQNVAYPLCNWKRTELISNGTPKHYIKIERNKK